MSIEKEDVLRCEITSLLNTDASDMKGHKNVYNNFKIQLALRIRDI